MHYNLQGRLKLKVNDDTLCEGKGAQLQKRVQVGHASVSQN